MAEARARAQFLGALVEQLFHHPSWQRLLVSLEPNQRKRIVDKWLSEKIAEYEAGVIESGPLLNEDSKDEMVYAQEMLVSDARENLYLQRYDKIKPETILTLQKAGISASYADDPHLLRAMLEAAVEAEKQHLNFLLAGTLRGDSSFHSPHKPLGDVTPETKPKSSSRPTKELIEEYLAYKKKEVTAKSLREYTVSYEVLLELLGDRPLGDLRRKDAVELRDELLDYPVNRSKGKNANLTLEEIKRQDEWRTISSTTAHKHFIRWAVLAAWATKWDYLPKNYLEGLAPEAEETSRRAWSKAELQRIFSVTSNEKLQQETLWRFWLPLLGLVTGARIDEICGLQVSDISQTEKGGWYLNFENNQYRRLKNKQSRRQTPLHSGLIKVGFIEYVQAQKPGLIFPSLMAYSSESLSHEPSKWFGRLKSGLGFDKEVNFHSFRHLMRNMLSDVEAQDSHIKAIVGHEQGDVTFGTYGDKLKPDLLRKHIEALPISEYLERLPHYSQLL